MSAALDDAAVIVNALRGGLPAEVRMGVEAGAQFAAWAAAERVRARSGRGLPGEVLGHVSWMMATPMRTDEAYPPNLWVVLDRGGRALAAGILNPAAAGGAR